MSGSADPAQSSERPAARSWDELIETMHGGLATVGDGCRFTYASDRFVGHVGRARNMVVARDAGQVFPSLAAEDPRGLRTQLMQGRAVSFEERTTDSTGLQRSLRIRVIPCENLGAQVRACAYSQDVTATSLALVRRRHATLRLTQAENDERSRVRREIRSGPIRLLDELCVRLDELDRAGGGHSVRNAARALSDEFRTALADLAAEDGESSLQPRLERWISPFLGSQIEMTIEDHTTTAPNEAVTQAIFLLIYESVRGARHVGRHRVQRLEVTDEAGGYRVKVRNSNTDGVGLSRGRTATQFRATVQYVESLGGTIANERGEDRVRTFLVWLPQINESQIDDDVGVGTAEPLLPAPSGHSPDPVEFPQLTEAMWEEVVRAAPEPLVEFDSQLNFCLANRAYEQLEGVTEAKLTSGSSLANLFSPAEVERLAPEVAKVRAGESRRFEWQREDSRGEPRFVRVSAWPRFDSEGTFAGALTIVEDRSDLHFLEQLHDSALVDLRSVMRHARHNVAEQLQVPMTRLQILVERLRDLGDSIPGSDRFHTLRREIEDVIPHLKESLEVMRLYDVSR